jgi:hypothetical protein
MFRAGSGSPQRKILNSRNQALTLIDTMMSAIGILRQL